MKDYKKKETEKVKVIKAKKVEVVNKDQDWNKDLDTRPPRKSSIPIVNKAREINVNAYRKLVQAEEGLARDLEAREEALGNLANVDLKIEANRLEREANKLKQANELRAQQREKKKQDGEDQIAGLEQDVKIAQLQKKLEKINNPEKPKKPDPMKAYEQELDEEMAKNKILNKKKLKELRDKINHGFEADQIIKEEFNRRREGLRNAYCEAYEVGNVNDLPEEAFKDWQDEDDFLDKQMYDQLTKD